MHVNYLKYKSLLIDFGGVLYRINPENTLKRFLELSPKNSKSVDTGLFYNTYIVPFEKGIISSGEFRNHTMSYLDIDITETEFDSIWNLTLEGLFPDSENIIKNLKKSASITLLSNTNPIHYKKFEPECKDMFTLFDNKIFSYLVGSLKPEKNIFELAVKITGVAAEKTLFVDDSILNIRKAKDMGFGIFHCKDHSLLSDFLDSVS